MKVIFPAEIWGLLCFAEYMSIICCQKMMHHMLTEQAMICSSEYPQKTELKCSVYNSRVSDKVKFNTVLKKLITFLDLLEASQFSNHTPSIIKKRKMFKR